MNFSLLESGFGRQRCQQWTPLFTQQLRLRHLYRIMGYNFLPDKQGGLYYTLHLTSMCAPFYTSEKIICPNPKWAELDIKNLPSLSVSAFVLRIWQECKNGMDAILLTWGINLSGLVYLGSKLSNIQPTSFNRNTVIFHMRGGYFTGHVTLRTDLPKPLPFIDNLNVISGEEKTKVYKCTGVRTATTDLKKSYNVMKLQKLHSLQIAIRNKSMDVELIRDKINVISGHGPRGKQLSSPEPCSSQESNVRYAPQLLTMTSLNKMLQGKSSKEQRFETQKIHKEIESARFKTKLLSNEKDKKTARLRHLKQKQNDLADANEDKNLKLMENYHKLNKDNEKCKEWKKAMIQHKELLSHCSYQLHHRRRQLMQQLLTLYPIHQINERKFIINGIYLPSSDLLHDCSDGGLSVSLGYVSHLLVMCSIFLQVPLRYPVTHYGSRSHIVDHISPSLTEKERDFPLFTKGKDRIHFDYAVYLLNKNIAQLRFLCGLHTPDLKATLPNLLGLLHGKGYQNDPPPPTKNHSANETKSRAPNDDGQSRNHETKSSAASHESTNSDGAAANAQKVPSLSSFGAGSSAVADPVLDQLKNECYSEKGNPTMYRYIRKTSKTKHSECGPGLSEILAIPEAFLNQEISSKCFKNFVAHEKRKLNAGEGCSSENRTNSSISSEIKEHSDTHSPAKQYGSSQAECSETIEQGTDLLSPSVDINSLESKMIQINSVQSNGRNSHSNTKNNRRKSRSEGSFIEDDEIHPVKQGLELGSNPLINDIRKQENKAVQEAATSELPSSVDDGQFLQKWLDSGPALVSCEEQLYPDEIMGTTSSGVPNAPLTERTNALLNTTSFNLIKKHQ